MTGHHLEIVPLSRHRWVVRYEGDPTPLSDHATLEEARVGGRNHARPFGESTIHVRELGGECHTEYINPDFRAPTPPTSRVPT